MGTLTSVLDCFHSTIWSDSEKQPVSSNNQHFCLHLQEASEHSSATSCVLWLSILWYKLMAFLVWPRTLNSSFWSHFSIVRQSSSTHLHSYVGKEWSKEHESSEAWRRIRFEVLAQPLWGKGNVKASLHWLSFFLASK